MSHKYVYLFSEGNATMRELLGGKGANLAEMTGIGLPVPQGFTISTEACTQYYEDGRQINPEIQAQIMEYIEKMEGITGKKFGDLENPLLVSVRSGARASMPGMMDTILNLGLNEEVVEAMIKGNLRPEPIQTVRNTEDVARMTRLYERAVALMEKKHPFLDAGFGLDDLAGALFTNRAYLSKTINILSGRNFRQFVNYYRIQYCMDLLRQDPNLKLINVALMSGFRTTASFNMAFKLNLGETPTQFQERVRTSKFKSLG